MLNLVTAAIAFTFPAGAVLAFVLTWWSGPCTIVFGVVMLILARRRRLSTPAVTTGATG